MMLLKHQVGDFLAHRFEELAVKDYFVVPGDYNLDLVDQLLRNPNLRMINCCNELNAGYAADGYARVSKSNIAVVVVTYMVGSLSVLNAIAGAYSEKLKVIVVCGGPMSRHCSSDPAVHHSLGIPDKDQSRKIFEQVTCASIRLDQQNTPDDIDHVLQECLAKSLPVYMEFPVDLVNKVFFDPTAMKPLVRPSTSGQLGNTDEALRYVWQAWVSARMPVLLVGGRARHFLSVKVIERFMSAIGCVAFYLLDGKSQLSEAHPQCGGLFWSVVSDPGVEVTVRESDLWITVGCRWNDLHTLRSLDVSKERSRILAIEESSIRTPDGHTINNIPTKAVIQALIERGLPPNDTSLKAFLQYQDQDLHSNQKYSPPGQNAESNVTLDNIVDRISSVISRNDTIVADAGESWFAASRVRLPPGADLQTQLLYSSTGWSLPASMGCQLARPDGRTIVILGDGSFQMTCQELSTMLRYEVNAIVVIINNHGYQIEEMIHKGPYNQIGSWNYAGLAAAIWHETGTGKSLLGKHSVFSAKIQTIKQLDAAFLHASLYPRVLAVLECCIDPAKPSSTVQIFGSKLVHSDIIPCPATPQ
ncbi:thiamine pyrophosphate-requiring enzyme [Aspergillus alliaceus]|uniref:thiamine pyrophosphate-requiring enzyme n=1 Tax=Petromyces alliaceus TaxID=209559 RepID=UPI0012A50401|nr:thiamine pyrophosphate-requiring enzyme [Aspergillus alliaceus]KAB8236981.1 thiamine pyrophosphate-requiring enzyme [Aspergillus alliaceus]